jgi:hypothetical protein
LSKYFDLYSVDGILNYCLSWLWNEVQHLVMIFTFFIPIDVWIAIFSGASLDGLWKVLVFYEPFIGFSAGIPSIVAEFFKVEMEDGWGILMN